MTNDVEEVYRLRLKKHAELVHQADQELKRCFREAEKALRRAADICVRSGHDSRRFEAGHEDARRAKEIQGNIDQFLGRLSTLGHIGVAGKLEDPDSIPESERIRLFRAQREEARKTAVAKKAQLLRKVLNGSEE